MIEVAEKRQEGSGSGGASVSPMDGLPNELVMAILVHVTCSESDGRASLVSRRFYDTIMGDPMHTVWQRAALHVAAKEHVDGSWMAVAADARGWIWVRRALDPLSSPARGRGLERCGDGRIVFGEFDGQRKHGYAVCVKPDQWWYAGQWRQDDMHGHGVWADTVGERYVGDFAYGKRHGHGVHNNARAATSIEGGWNADQPHGYCVIRYANGDCLKGTYLNGTPEDDLVYVCDARHFDTSHRPLEIAGRWVRHRVYEKASGRGFWFSHPDPAVSPDAFRLFYRHFGQGHVLVFDDMRDAVAGLLADAARRTESRTTTETATVQSPTP